MIIPHHYLLSLSTPTDPLLLFNDSLWHSCSFKLLFLEPRAFIKGCLLDHEWLVSGVWAMYTWVWNNVFSCFVFFSMCSVHSQSVLVGMGFSCCWNTWWLFYCCPVLLLLEELGPMDWSWEHPQATEISGISWMYRVTCTHGWELTVYICHRVWRPLMLQGPYSEKQGPKTALPCSCHCPLAAPGTWHTTDLNLAVHGSVKCTLHLQSWYKG